MYDQKKFEKTPETNSSEFPKSFFTPKAKQQNMPSYQRKTPAIDQNHQASLT